MPVRAHAPLLLPVDLAPASSRSSSARPSAPLFAIALQQGVLTTIHASSPPTASSNIRLRLNGETVHERWPSRLISAFSSRLDGVPLQIEQTTSLPNLGPSLLAARVLSLSLALNAWCPRPIAASACAGLAQKILRAGGHASAANLVHLRGGLLRLKPSARRISQASAHPFLPHDLRTPIRLSHFGPEPKRQGRPSKTSPRVARPSSVSVFMLAAASRQFHLQSNPRHWAAPLLSPRPRAGLVAHSRTLFEPGIRSDEPMMLTLDGQGPRTLVAYPTNEGARVL